MVWPLIPAAGTTPLHRLAAWRPLVWVGERSYGIYLWNLPLVAIVAATPVPDPAQAPLKLALTFLVPALSYRFVERPCLRAKERFATVGADQARPRSVPTDQAWTAPRS